MAYDSPKQIRRRQQRQNDAPRRTRIRSEVRVWTDEEWASLRDYQFHCLENQIAQGDSRCAGIYARTLAHMALQHRAQQIMRDHGRAYWKAMRMAEHELLNCEIQ